jgi:phage shock protein A
MAGFWNYLKQLFRSKSEQLKDPEIEIEQVITEARERDQDLRNQAAKVIAHRTMVEHQLEDSGADVGKAKEMAKQALLRADEATRSGDAEAAGKWNRAAQSLAMKLQAAQNNIDSLKQQYQVAVQQSEQAKQAVQQNAMRVQELSAKRLEMLGQLQQAKMQETVNKAVQSMSSTMDMDSPSLDSVEQKINQRLAEAQAKAELHSATPEGAEMELEESVSLAQADSTLEQLRKELGLPPAPTPGALPSGGGGGSSAEAASAASDPSSPEGASG